MIKWTLYKKIQLILLLFMSITFSISHFTLTELIENTTRQNFKNNVVNTAVLLQQNIEVIFNDATNTLSFINQEYSNKYRNDVLIRDYLMIMNDTKDYIVNSFVAYEDKSYVLVPYTDLVDFDPTQREWYKQAQEVNTIVWSKPYIDIVTNDLVITGSIHIHLLNTEGVIGLDIKLDSIPGIINKTKIGRNGLVLLVDSEGYIIGDSSNTHMGKTLEVLGDPTLYNSNLITGYLETSKGLYYMRFLSKTDMRLIAYLPHSDLLDAAQSPEKTSRFILLISLVIGLILSYFLARRITKPISRLTSTMALSKGKDSLIIFNEETNDEINTLIKGYNDLVLSVNSQNNYLKEMSNELKESEEKLQEQYEKVAKLAYIDSLTNMPNRVSFEQQAKVLINSRIKFYLYYIDLDNFKYINDTYGHNYGDFVLQVVSKRFVNCCDGKYFSARLSGDEFGLLVTETERDEVDKIAEKILQIVNDPISFNELDFYVTVSIGISIFPDDGKSFVDLMSNADIAMYEAKRKSKNQFMVFNKTLRSNMLTRISIETKMQSALEQGEFYLTYQPLYNLDNNELCGFEALLRWESDKLGLIMPSEFIPIAERNLFIIPLGYFVLEEAIKFGLIIREKRGQFLEMNVNVSTIQLHLDSFTSDVDYLLEKYDYPRQYLNIEITETLALSNDVIILNKLRDLQKTGIRISLDDFGTGYSSINHLININLSHLKIDRSIIQDAVLKNEVKKLLKGVVDFAHAIDIIVIAEGIENLEMETMVHELNIDIAQGYLYSKPMRDNVVIKFLRDSITD